MYFSKLLGNLPQKETVWLPFRKLLHQILLLFKVMRSFSIKTTS